MKITNVDQITTVKINLTDQEKKVAKKIAKAQGYTFQGWLGNLVREATKDYISVTPSQIPNINHSSDSPSLTPTFRKD